MLFSRVCHQFYHSLRRNSSTLSPPLATIGVISSDLSATQLFSSCKNSSCSVWLTTIVINTILLSLSGKRNSTLSRTEGWIRIHLCCASGAVEKNSSPNSILQIFSSFTSEYVSLKKQNLDFGSLITIQKNAPLFTLFP